MPSAKQISVETVTVAFVNEPEGRGPGSIKDTKGRYWKVWRDKLEEIGFEPKKTYAISFTDDEYRGKVSHTVIGAQPVAAPNGPVAQQLPLNNPDRDTNIAVLALVKGVPEFGVAVSNGDVEAAVKILRICRLVWKDYLKPAAVRPSPVVVASEVTNPPEYEFNDEIPD